MKTTREIKFRGKRIDNGEWVYGDLLKPNGSCRIVNYEYSPNDMGVCIDYHYFDVEEESVGQYTGLKDNNGKEIFEGDILHVCEYQNGFMDESMEFRETFDISELKGKFLEEYTDEVVFEEGCFSVKDTCLFALFGDQRHSSPIFEFEVIGNIHDNPELLKHK